MLAIRGARAKSAAQAQGGLTCWNRATGADTRARVLPCLCLCTGAVVAVVPGLVPTTCPLPPYCGALDPLCWGTCPPSLLVGAASRHGPQPHHLTCCSYPGCSYNAAFAFFDCSLASSGATPHLLDFVSSPQIHGPSVAAQPFSLSGWEIHDNMLACLARNSAARARRAARWRPVIPTGSRLPSCLKIVLLVGGHVPQLCYAPCLQGA